MPVWSVDYWHVTRRSFLDEPHHHNDDQENQPDRQQAELDLGQQVGNLHQMMLDNEHPPGNMSVLVNASAEGQKDVDL